MNPKFFKIRSISLVVFASISFFNCFSQQPIIKINTKQEVDNSFTFSYEKEKFGSYRLSIKFDFLSNAPLSDYEGVVSSKSGTLFKLKPRATGQSISFRYSTTYILGNPNTRIDTSFIYLLPYPSNISATVTNMKFLGEQYFRNVKPKNWKAFHFTFDTTTTAIAARKGIVIDVINKYEVDKSESTIYSSMQNYLVIEHEDGSLATYQGFKKDSFKVADGDIVFPNTPLGSIEKMYTGKNYGLSVMFYFLNDKEFKKAADNVRNQNLYNQKCSYEFYDPLFLTNTGVTRLKQNKKYLSTTNESIIIKEMSKRG
jgi:hypothetical protein